MKFRRYNEKVYLSLLNIPPWKKGRMYQFDINGMIKSYIEHLGKMRGIQ